MRHYARLAAFSLPIVRRLLERATSAPPDLRVVSDHAWSNTTQSTDLGGTITMDQTAATVANLIRYRLPEYPKVLDVGCAGGTLAGELPPSVHYLGIDASESAIEAAQSLWGGDDILFAARDIREFDPVGDWDAIVFSEVLSYLSAHEAIAEVRRYAKALSPEGVVAITMMNDRKSRAIWRALRQEFRWIDGILWQQKEPWPSYRISVSRGRPAIWSACSDYGTSAEGRRIDTELVLKRRGEQISARRRRSVCLTLSKCAFARRLRECGDGHRACLSAPRDLGDRLTARRGTRAGILGRGPSAGQDGPRRADQASERTAPPTGLGHPRLHRSGPGARGEKSEAEELTGAVRNLLYVRLEREENTNGQIDADQARSQRAWDSAPTLPARRDRSPGPQWLHEIKLDGFRVSGRIKRGRCNC